MKNREKKLLIELLSLPTFSGMEFLVSDFIKYYAIEKNYEFFSDDIGNLYFNQR